jgi:hypothetical protein
MSVSGIQVGAGINVGAGVGLGASGSGPSGPLTFTYSQIFANEDQSPGAGGNGTGIVIINATYGGSTGPGIALATDSSQQTAIAALTPIPAAGSALQYTATWSAGSTYLTTPVQVEYAPSGFGPGPMWVVYVMNPSATAGQAGTFNFPVTFTATPNTPISIFP